MNCNDDADNSAKWTCKKCTYDNFQKSIKCTICLTPNTNNNNTKYIINEINDQCTSSSNNLIDSSSSSQLNNNNCDTNNKKWNCSACTYLNWPKSVKCVQCLTPKQQQQQQQSTTQLNDNDNNSIIKKSPNTNCISSSSSSSSSSNDDCQSSDHRLIKVNNNLNTINSVPNNDNNNFNSCKQDVKNDDVIVSNKEISDDDSKLKLVKPSTSSSSDNKHDHQHHHSNQQHDKTTQINNSSSTTTNSSLNNSLNSSLNSLNNDHHNTLTSSTNLNDKLIDNLQTSLNKWNCSSCTYLNWPKSLKCVICQTPKSLNTTTTSTTTTINSTSTTNDLNYFINKQQLIATNNTPPSSTNSMIETSSTNDKRNTPSPTEPNPQHQHINRLNINSNNNLNGVNTIISNYNHLNSSTNNRSRKTREQFVDWIWLEACIGVLNADPEPVLLYLNNGGDLGRQLTLIEVNFLNKQTLLGYTLVHLAIRFKRSEILEILLENRSPNRAKRVPCQVSAIYGHEVRKLLNSSLKQTRKADFPCYFVNDFCTFALPQDILELSPSVQECLFEDLLDKDVQNELEESSIINWSLEVNVQLGSRLYALWNRSKGDCLLDSVLQATYGCFDKDNRLRKALADSLNDASNTLFVRFKEAEILKVSHQLPYTLEMQWEDDWAVICSCASQPGTALEQFHIFVLSHIFRRPIIVYGIKFFKSYRGEKLALAGFQGIYLPLHLDPKFCSKSPISLAYTKGHFTALVPMEGMTNLILGCICENGQVNSNCTNCVVPGAGSIVKSNSDSDCCYLPLVTSERELLPLQFLIKSELGRQEEIMRQYLDCCVTEEGLLVAKQRLQIKKPFPIQQMINEWLDFYRNIPTIVNCSTQSSNDQSNNVSKSTNDTTNLNPYLSADEDSD